MVWENLKDESVVFIVRDPRDIVVSLAHYQRGTVQGMLQGVSKGRKFKAKGPWQTYVNSWLETRLDYSLVRYEDLLSDCTGEITRVLKECRLPINHDRLELAVERQSFAVRRKDIAEHGDKLAFGKNFNVRFLRKGIAGDWKNHFTREMGQQAQESFGNLMKHFGYIEKDDWWKELS